MHCEEARIGLYALLDDELDIATNVEILSHLEGCPACQWELELDVRLKALVRAQLCNDAPPPELWATILQRLEQEGQHARHPWLAFGRLWPRARRLQAALAAVAVVVVFTLVLVVIVPTEAPSLLVDELIADHLRLVAQESAPADMPASDSAEIVARLRAQMPSPAPTPLLAQEGARLVGGSVCQLGQTKGIRFIYELQNDQTVSLYQLNRSGQAPFPQPTSGLLYVSRPRSPGIVLWGNERFLYALVGELPPEVLERLASHLQRF